MRTMGAWRWIGLVGLVLYPLLSALTMLLWPDSVEGFEPLQILGVLQALCAVLILAGTATSYQGGLRALAWLVGLHLLVNAFSMAGWLLVPHVFSPTLSRLLELAQDVSGPLNLSYIVLGGAALLQEGHARSGAVWLTLGAIQIYAMFSPHMFVPGQAPSLADHLPFILITVCWMLLSYLLLRGRHERLALDYGQT